MWSRDEKEKKIILLKKDLYRNPQTFYYGDNFSPGTFPIKLGTNINGFTAFLGKFDYDEKNNEITIGVPNDRALGDIKFLLEMVDIPVTFKNLIVNLSDKKKIKINSLNMNISNIIKHEGNWAKGELIIDY